MSDNKNKGFPSELNEPVANLHKSIDKISSDVIEPLSRIKSAKDNESHLWNDLPPLEKARIDLISAFALNSLAWVWLKSQGHDPKETEVKNELNRVKARMQRLKEITIKNTPHARIDKNATKRFVASGLWQPGEKKIKFNTDDQPDKKKAKK